MATYLVSKYEDKFFALIIENTFLSIVSYLLIHQIINQKANMFSTLAIAHSTCIPTDATFDVSLSSAMAFLQKHPIYSKDPNLVPFQWQR